MKKVMQQSNYEKDVIHGDCWESCILSITELDRSLLPSVNDKKYKGETYWSEFYTEMQLALEKNGWELNCLTVNQFEDNGEYFIASGDSPRGQGIKHAVVWKGGIVHDPHETDSGLLTITLFESLTKIDG